VLGLQVDGGGEVTRRARRVLPGQRVHQVDVQVLEARAARDLHGAARLAAAGFEQYEVSAYARSGAQCRHNLNYWSFGDYLGIGAGAHGKLSSAASGSVERHWKLRQPEAYMRGAEAGAPDSGRHDVAPDDLVFEFMLNALRLNAGFTPGLFEARCALPWSRVEGRIAAAETQGLLRRDAGAVHVTALGRQFLNDLTARFLPGD
jgi:oxygen-independent coproporphyrinogen-3 oxidase